MLYKICVPHFLVMMILVCVTLVTPHIYAERKIFTFSANSTTANLAEGKEFTLLSGDAEVTADDVLITAGEIKLYGDDFQFAEVSDRFKAIDLKNDFSLEGDKLFYDRQEKLLRAEGNVIMQDNQNDVVVRARFLESKEDGKFMVMQLGVKITKKDELSARSEFLTYYRETEILELTGFPYALWKDDEYSAERVSINLDTDEVSLEGKVKGTISTLDTEDELTETEDELTETEDELTETEDELTETEDEIQADGEMQVEKTEEIQKRDIGDIPNDTVEQSESSRIENE